MVLLHLLFMLYSLTGVFSKKASGEEFLSFKFILFYGLVVLLLFIYAILWQQVIKRMKLTTAFSNKAVTVVWGLIWGVLFFAEKITAGKLIGAALVMAGVILFGIADGKEDDGV